jgi:hypothetical protein
MLAEQASTPLSSGESDPLPNPPPILLANEADWATAGAVFARLMLSMREWVHRRVDTITFVDQTVLRRHVSVDFTLPAILPPLGDYRDKLLLLPVPLTTMRKRTLTNFDLVDENGGSMPLLARRQHQTLATEALYQTVLQEFKVEREDTHTGADPGGTETDETKANEARTEQELRSACHAVVTSHPGKADDALARLYSLGLDQAAFAGSLARMLSESFFVTVMLPFEWGRHRVLKFSNDELVGDPPLGLRRAFERGAGWRSKYVWLPADGMRDVPNYHLEVQAPTGLWIVKRELIVTDADLEPRSGPYTRARFYHQPKANSHGLAMIYLRPQTSTIVRAAALVSWLAFGLLLGTFFALWWGGFDSDTNAPALLLFLAGVASPVLVRPSEHAMTTDMLWLIRLLTLIPSGLAFIGGAAFAALPAGSPALLWLFGALAFLAYIPTAILTMGWRLCVFPSDPDREKTRAAFTY